MNDQWEREWAALRAELAELRAAIQTQRPSDGGGRRGASDRNRRRKRMVLVALPIVAMLATGGVLFGQGAIQALFIDQKGQVGIGTTTPAMILDVKEDSIIGTSATNETQHSVKNQKRKVSFGYQLPGTSEFVGMRALVAASPNHKDGNTADISFDTWEYTTAYSREVMRINGTGNVGIGKSNPQAKLDVDGDIKATSMHVGGNVQIDGTITHRGIAGIAPIWDSGWVADQPFEGDTNKAQFQHGLGAMPALYKIYLRDSADSVNAIYEIGPSAVDRVSLNLSAIVVTPKDITIKMPRPDASVIKDKGWTVITATNRRWRCVIYGTMPDPALSAITTPVDDSKKNCVITTGSTTDTVYMTRAGGTVWVWGALHVGVPKDCAGAQDSDSKDLVILKIKDEYMAKYAPADTAIIFTPPGNVVRIKPDGKISVDIYGWTGPAALPFSVSYPAKTP